MYLECRLSARLPKLAWAAKVNRATGEVVVRHGACAETRDTFLSRAPGTVNLRQAISARRSASSEAAERMISKITGRLLHVPLRVDAAEWFVVLFLR